MSEPTHEATPEPTAVPATCGCSASCGCSDKATTTAPATLHIVGQRLESEGETCPHCGSTQAAVEHAVATLTEAVRPLSIVPALETVALDQAAFERTPSKSNWIWIVGRPLQDWLGAGVSDSQCCLVCGENNCRTLELDGASYEAVPEALIVKAGLAAAVALIKA